MSRLVSVVIPVFNAESFIERTIESVLSQTYRNLEIQVIDDKSTDKTAHIVNELMLTDKRISFYSLDKNYGGPAKARNIGVERAKGDIIAFLDADDIWKPNKLEECLKYDKYDIIHHYEAFFITDEKNIVKTSRPKYSENIYKKLLYSNLFSPSSILIKRELLLKYKFNESPVFNGVEDYELWIRIFKNQNCRIKLVESSLTLYRVHTGGISKSFLEHGQKERNLIRLVFSEFKVPADIEMVILMRYKLLKSILSNFVNIYRFHGRFDIRFLIKELRFWFC